MFFGAVIRSEPKSTSQTKGSAGTLPPNIERKSRTAFLFGLLKDEKKTQVLGTLAMPREIRVYTAILLTAYSSLFRAGIRHGLENALHGLRHFRWSMAYSNRATRALVGTKLPKAGFALKIGRASLPMLLLVAAVFSAQNASAQCSSPANPIIAENCQTGSPSSQWDIQSNISNAGDPSIQGFGTDISVNVGQTIYFKINTAATSYRLDIYRMGYYGGMGARKVATILPSATLPQKQPACLTDPSTNLYDCGNWALSASWNVPSTAVSGIYFAHLVRTDKSSGDSHIHFVVRNDASHSDLYFQTSDESWQAYNDYGGHSLYGGAGTFDLPNRAMKVSYNRPFDTRSFEDASFVYSNEYPMVRWLEANGYDVSYFTGLDAARNGSLIQNHKVYLSVGHDEYVSGPQRTSVQAALASGVNLSFFSGNEWFWKTRWENSIDGTNTPYRTMVCYKETLSNAKTDPSDPPTWTGTWRDGRFSPPADGGKPENALTGTLFMVNGPGSDNSDLAISVTAQDGRMRFWRNTSMATLSAGKTATLPPATLGYEWDADVDNGFRPAGLVGLSTSTYTLKTDLLLDQGGIYGAGTATHRLSMYRAPSGALVFGAGTVQWSWGLDSNHDSAFSSGPPSPDVRMQQATVNIFADMGIQPASIQSGLTPTVKSTDTQPPTSTIVSPASGANVTGGEPVTVSGTAADSGGGIVGAVEVSVDAGQTWHPASGRENWSYSWTPGSFGAATIMSRAADDSGNLQTTPAQDSVTVIPHDCPCTLLNSGFTPSLVDGGDGGAYELGVNFTADYDGYITGIRFYKSSANTGTHTGHLWSSSGQLLASATFTSESSSGWQTVTFSNLIPVSAGSTYIASYSDPAGHYSIDTNYFALTGINNPPLHAPAGSNDVFGTVGAFPTSMYLSSNYSVDVIYIPAGSISGAPASLVALPGHLNFTAPLGLAQASSAPQVVTLYNQGSSALTWRAAASAPWIVLSATSGTTPATLSVSANASGLTAGQYSGTVTITPAAGGGSPQLISVTMTATNILLNSNFSAASESSGDSNGGTEGWAVSPLGLGSNWSIVNQALQYNGNGSTQRYAGNSAWTDYTLQVGLKLSTAADYPGGFRGRVNPSTGAAYTVWLYPAQGTITLFKTVAWDINAGYTQLGTASIGYDTQSFHNYAISFQGSNIRVLYDGNVVITATDSTNSSGMAALDVANQVVTYNTVLVTSNNATVASLAPSPASLTFTGDYNGTNPSSQTVNLNTSGTGTVAWTAVSTAPWLTVSSLSGTTPASFQASVNTSGLAPGTYTGSIRVASLGVGNSPQSIPVTLTVASSPAGLALSPSAVSFTALLNQPNPPAQNLIISNLGYGPLNWSASADSPWLSVTPGSGTTPATASIGVSSSGMALGNYSGTVTVSSPGIPNSPQSVPVNLSIVAPDLTETFTDLASGWVISPMGQASSWSVSSGVYAFTGNNKSQSCAGNTAWSDYTFDTNVRLANMTDWPGGVRGRVNPNTGAGYLVWLYPANGFAILFKIGQWDVNGSVLTQLAEAPLTFDTTNFHDLQMAFSGSQISVSWDGNPLMSATDGSYASGYVCMDTGTQPISYQNVRVASSQTPLTLAAAPTSLTFTAAPGSAPTSQTVAVNAGGNAATTWGISTSASWLTASASTSITPGTITVSVNPAGLAEGTYTGTVTLSAPGATNSPLVINVAFSIAAASSALKLSATSLHYSATAGQPAPAAQAVTITNSGSGFFAWSASSSSSWLQVSPNSGSVPSTASISVIPSGLAPGQYTGTVTISATGITNSPQSVLVSLSVLAPDLTETFTDLASGWVISPMGQANSWSVSSGIYAFTGNNKSQSCAGNTAWSDYTFDTNVRLSNMNDWPGGVRGRVNPNTGAGYLVWIYPANGFAILYKIGQWDVNGSVLTQLAEAPLTFDTTNFHDLQMAFSGSQISVSWDGNPLMSATDSSYTTGYVCMDTGNQPISYQNVRVSSSETAVTLAASPASLTFSAAPGATPASQTVTINAGTAATTWGVTTSASWLTASASTSITPGTITVSVNPAGLAEGTYTGTVTLSAPGATNSPLVIPVTFGLQTALLSATPTNLVFFGSTGSNPASQTVSVTNTGTGTLNWIATADSPWIGMNPTNGSAPSSIQVSPNTSGFAIGPHSGIITITSPNAANGPAHIPVSLQLGNALFFDNFASGTASNWTVSPQGNASGWTALPGAYSYNGQGGTQSFAGSSSWTNYTVSADFKVSSFSDWPGGIRGRLNTSTGASYGVWIYPAEQFLILYRIGQWDINAQLTQLGPPAPVSIDTAHTHNIRLSFNGSQIQVYYDNALAIQANDSTYTQGAIALDVANQPISFTNVTVIGF